MTIGKTRSAILHGFGPRSGLPSCRRSAVRAGGSSNPPVPVQQRRMTDNAPCVPDQVDQSQQDSSAASLQTMLDANQQLID